MSLSSHKRKKVLKKLKRWIGFILLIIVLFIAAVELIAKLNKNELSAKELADAEKAILNFIEQGEYASAAKDIERFNLAEMQSFMHDSLRIDIDFKYIPETKDLGWQGIGGVELSSKEPYSFHLNTHEKCFLYLFQKTSNGNYMQLFPNPDFSFMDNPVMPGEFRLPGGRKWIFLDDEPGMKQVYLFASRWRQRKLEKVFQNMQIENLPSDQSNTAFLEYAHHQDDASGEYPGLVFSTFRIARRTDS